VGEKKKCTQEMAKKAVHRGGRDETGRGRKKRVYRGLSGNQGRTAKGGEVTAQKRKNTKDQRTKERGMGVP